MTSLLSVQYPNLDIKKSVKQLEFTGLTKKSIFNSVNKQYFLQIGIAVATN